MANPLIFRAYDIRGIYKKDFDENDAKLIGKAYAHLLKPKTIVIGYDNRESSTSLKEFLVEGLLESGVDVIDIGMVPTPLLYFSIIKLGADGGIMITASHLQKEYNGFKLCREQALPLMDTDIQEIRRVVEKKVFGPPSLKWGKYSRKSMVDTYSKEILEKTRTIRRLKIAIDTGNGTGGPIARKIFGSMNVEPIFLFSEPDGNYPNHHPDPTVEETLKDLIAAVRANNCDFGMAMDGDADRIIFLDENANVIRSDQALAIFAGDVLARKKKAGILFEVRSSRMLPEYITAKGGEPIMGRIGHSFIKQRMHNDSSIILAGEVSGHIFFREFYGIDDAFFAGARMVEILSSQEFSMSEILSSLPKYHSTPEIRIEVDEAKKFGIVEKISEEFKSMFEKGSFGIEKIIDIDGVRVEFDDGWGLVRASNTSPVLSMRFEARTRERMEEISKFFDSLVKKHM